MKSLDISRACIGDDGAVSLADALCHNTMLVSLDLYSNEITCSGAKALAKMLHQNTSLELLGLSRNGIGNEGLAELGKSLQVNSSLQYLHLADARFGNDGLLGLADGLTHNNGLKELNLNFNIFMNNDLEGMEALGKSLKVNSTLEVLDLSCILAEESDAILIATVVNALDGKTGKLQVNVAENIYGQFPEPFMDRMVHCNAPLLTLDLTENYLQPTHIQCTVRKPLVYE